MLNSFVSFLRFIWPFIRESLLQGSGLRRSLSKNKVSVMWMMMLVIQMASIFYLVDLILAHRKVMSSDKSTINLTESNLKNLTQRVSELTSELNQTRSQLSILTNSDYKNKSTLSGLDEWFKDCGIKINLDSKILPSCPTSNKNKSPPVIYTKKEIDNKKTRSLESIWGKDKDRP